MDYWNRVKNLLRRATHPPSRALHRVRHALHRHDLDAAEHWANLAKQKYPLRPDVNALYAQIHAKRENWENVQAGIDCIVENRKSGFAQRLAAARLYAKLGQVETAIETYEHLGRTSQGFNAGLTWNAIANLRQQQGLPEKALAAFAQCAQRTGPLPWVRVIQVVRKCSLESVVACRQSMLEWTGEEASPYRTNKFISLLEQKLVQAKICERQTMVRSMRMASRRGFRSAYPRLEFSEQLPPLKPKFLIIGAMKCGTTTLHELMNQHPNCLSLMDKEIQFFQFPELCDQWYLEHFPRISPELGLIAGDASPGYYAFDIVDRVSTLLPDVKLIFIQRDPARRAISHLRHNARIGMPDFPPDQIISSVDRLQAEIEASPQHAEQIILDITFGKRKQSTFAALGCYELLLRRWRRVFPSNQLLAIDLETLSESPQETMHRVFEFVDLDPIEIEPVESNPGNYIDFDPETQRLFNRFHEFFTTISQLTASP